LKFSISIDRNGKGSPKSEFFSLNFIANGPTSAPKEAQGEKCPLSNFGGRPPSPLLHQPLPPPPSSRDVINRTGISGLRVHSLDRYGYVHVGRYSIFIAESEFCKAISRTLFSISSRFKVPRSAATIAALICRAIVVCRSLLSANSGLLLLHLILLMVSATWLACRVGQQRLYQDKTQVRVLF